MAQVHLTGLLYGQELEALGSSIFGSICPLPFFTSIAHAANNKKSALPITSSKKREKRRVMKAISKMNLGNRQRNRESRGDEQHFF
jgi:hypothetical protein